MCYNGTALLVAAELIRSAPQWTDAHEQRFTHWVENVFRGATSIKSRNNNWACWGIFGSLMTHVYLKDREGLRQDGERLKDIIAGQIEADGSMPHEIKRGKNGFWYTYFALAPMTAAAEVLRNSGGPDLFAYQPADKGSIEDAVGFFYENGIQDPSKWPRNANIDPDPAGKHGALLYSMGIVYDRKEWREFAEHPIWRGYGGLAWMNPGLIRPSGPISGQQPLP
jgi:hypothetical protein